MNVAQRQALQWYNAAIQQRLPQDRTDSLFYNTTNKHNIEMTNT
jgi:hypothetical protein